MKDIKPDQLKAYYPHYEQLCDIDWISLTDETIGVLVRDKKLGSFVDSTNLSSVQLRIVNTVRDSEESADWKEQVNELASGACWPEPTNSHEDLTNFIQGLLESAVQAERTRIIKAFESYQHLHGGEHCEVFSEAIKAVGESATNE